MITKPTLFENDYNRSGAVNDTIVKLTDGSTTWYFAESKYQFGTVHVYDLLKAHSGMRSGTDIIRKQAMASQVTIELNNNKVIHDSDILNRPSDLLEGTRGQVVELYLLAGNQVTDIETHCLKRFSGIVTNIEYDMTSVRISVIGNYEVLNIILPDTFIGDVYSPVFTKNADKKVPIVYGKYNSIKNDEDYNKLDALGLAIAVRISGFMNSTNIVSDHLCDALGTDSIYQKIKDLHLPAVYASTDVNITLNDSGRTTYTIDIDAIAYAFFLMNDASDQGTVFGHHHAHCVDYENALDGDPDTLNSMQDDTDSGTDMAGGALFAIDNISWLLDAIPDDISDVKADEYIQDVRTQSTYYDTDAGNDIENLHILNDKTALSTPVNHVITDSGVPTSGTWDTYGDLIANLYGVKFNQVFIEFHRAAGADGTPDNLTLGQLSGIRIRCEMKRSVIWKEWEDYTIWERAYLPERKTWLDIKGFTPFPLGQEFVGCDGMAYGSWITGRSSNYSDGDCIEDPAGIVESILRDRLGLVSADIDMPSFINAENTTIQARINLHSYNEMSAMTAIQQLSEQSTFTFVWTAQGKARLIDNHTTYGGYSTDKIFAFSDIVDGSLKLKKKKFIVNTINAHSRMHQEQDYKFQDYNTFNNSASETSFGERIYNAKWPNIAGASVTEVAQHYINTAAGSSGNDDGVWANEHNEIEFITHAFIASDLEEGDRIELDDTVDPHLLLYGSSWSGRQFIVESLTQFMNQTKIMAVEIFTA